MPAGLRRVRNLFIDLDDTLLVEVRSALESFSAAAAYLHSIHDHIGIEDFVAAARTAAREAWHALPTIEYAQKIGISSWEGLWAEFSDFNDDQKILKTLKEPYRISAWTKALSGYGIDDPALARTLSMIYADERRKKQLLFEDSLPFLRAVKESPRAVALLSNGSPDLQRLKIEKSGLGAYFSDIFISGEIGWKKPEREIFDYCLAALAWDPKETVMIGDSLKSDILGAKNSGIASIWINREGMPLDGYAAPDFTAAGLMEAWEIIG
jgi:putative hydrolase of the HAD superfamily